jgi:hypothetical protein
MTRHHNHDIKVLTTMKTFELVGLWEQWWYCERIELGKFGF